MSISEMDFFDRVKLFHETLKIKIDNIFQQQSCETQNIIIKQLLETANEAELEMLTTLAQTIFVVTNSHFPDKCSHLQSFI